MLSQLYIKNIAVISEATIEFVTGLNAFTGETGAGKTILIGAINIVLGGRASKDIIRTGENKAVVSALFTSISEEICAAISELGFAMQSQDDLLITREIEADGRGSSKINGRPANLAILREVSSMLISVHGQQDNYELLNIDRHMQYIDSFGSYPELLEEYNTKYGQYTALRKELESLEIDEGLKAQRLDILSYQINEIDSANLESGEEEELKAQRKIIRNAERIAEALSLCAGVLSGDGEQPNIIQLTETLDEGLSEAAKFFPEFEQMAAKAKEYLYELEDISQTVRHQLESSEYDPRMLDTIELRLDTIHRLNKKYGGSIEQVLLHLEKCQNELENLKFSDERKDKLLAELETVQGELAEIAQRLTDRRLLCAEQFIEKVQSEMAFLDMPRVRLSIAHSKKEFAPGGWDNIEFLISTNMGEEPKPLAKIASGGEMARTMLAIKNVLSDKENIGTLIFDEVDTGVSGRAAQKIGQKLRQVSGNRQVICVTHLAQVASYAHHHLYIFKEIEGERTFTRVNVLDRQERVRELARITVGENITEISLKNAEEMLLMAENTADA